MGKMQDVSTKQGRTVVFVSHQMGVVSALCQRGILLEKGRLVANDSVNAVVPLYLKSGAPSSGELLWPDGISPRNGRIRFNAVRVRCGDEIASEVPLSAPIEFELEFETLVDGLLLHASFHLLDHLGNCILATSNLPSATSNNDEWGYTIHPRGRYKSLCTIPPNFLNEGSYSISAFVVSNASEIEVQARECLSFQTHDAGEMRKEFTGTWIGVIRPKLDWHTELLR
jgi:lipopolysaccharide transport system ATP-binding protein